MADVKRALHQMTNVANIPAVSIPRRHEHSALRSLTERLARLCRLFLDQEKELNLVKDFYFEVSNCGIRCLRNAASQVAYFSGYYRCVSMWKENNATWLGLGPSCGGFPEHNLLVHGWDLHVTTVFAGIWLRPLSSLVEAEWIWDSAGKSLISI